MFLWDWAMGAVMDALVDWLYTIVVSWLGTLLAGIGNMGYELMELSFVQALLHFFYLLGWALFVVGLVVAVFETAVDYQNGRASIKESGLNAIKGFMAVSLFTITPIQLFKLSINLQVLMVKDLASLGATVNSWSDAWQLIMDPYTSATTVAEMGSALANGLSGPPGPIFSLFFIIMIAYAFVKVFFASLKRGGILIVQIAVGSLYMFSVPRGYADNFYNWCKQVIGLCLTSFMQGIVLTLGALILKDHPLLGLGLMLSATEVPRIAGAFGLDTSMRVNVMGAVHGAQMAAGAVKTISHAVGK